MGMRPSIGSSGMGISSGNSGSSRSTSVSVNQGGVTVGINIGVAEIGVTTDYGGAGKIGFGGQSVTWGLEGGRIQMGIAGFELVVEARNCVVTETKKIAGMIVASRTYPDPGCKKEEEGKTPTPTPTPTPGDDGTDRLGEGLAWVVINEVAEASGSVTEKLRQIDYAYQSKMVQTITRNGSINIKNGLLDLTVFSAVTTYSKTINSKHSTPISGNCTTITQRNRYSHTSSGGGITAYSFYNYDSMTKEEAPQGFDQNTPAVLTVGVSYIAYGQQQIIKASIKEHNARPDYNVNRTTSTPLENTQKMYRRRRIVGEIIPLNSPPPSPPTGGNRPPMNSSCCKAILADLEDLKEVLAVKEMLKGECTFPWRLRMPGGKGEEKITDYANYLRALAQEIDHLGIHPPNLYIQDNNNAQEGDQTVDIKFPSATSAFEALMRQVWDDNADGDTRTNFLYRLAWLSVQNQEMCLRTIAIVKAIAHGLGIETEVDTAKIPIPFNITAGIKKNVTRGQGFGKGSNPKPQIDNRIDLNTEIATEALLPEFLQCKENEVLIETFSGDKEIMSILSLILMHVEKLNSK